MAFKRMCDAFGAGAPSAATSLVVSRTQPGGTLSGEIRLKGGEVDAEIDHIGLCLVAPLWPARGVGDPGGGEEFSRTRISGPVPLCQGDERAIQFQVAVPWETPISEIGGRHLTGMALGVRTEVATATAVDKGDLHQVAVRPVPSQLLVLRAFARLGFPFKCAVLHAGRLNGGHQELPFHQKIEFYPSSRHTGAVHEVGLAFVSSSSGLEVTLEVGRPGGRRFPDERFEMSHEEALHTDWPSVIDRWLAGLLHHGGRGERDRG
ncbi:sporulation protein [Nonomuraea sp. NPDC050643]|uniref:sporulation protein n=1 Tax=Nonomuraea sp. NPDC050643 TaxID=3155660 RepID=UPI0033CD0763